MLKLRAESSASSEWSRSSKSSDSSESSDSRGPGLPPPYTPRVEDKTRSPRTTATLLSGSTTTSSTSRASSGTAPVSPRSSEGRAEKARALKAEQHIASKGRAKAIDLHILWTLCRKKLSLKPEDVMVMERLLFELHLDSDDIELTGMNAEALIETIGFLSRSISPGDFHRFRAVLNQLNGRGDVLLAAGIPPFFFTFLNAVGDFDVSRDDSENARAMANPLEAMRAFLNPASYGLSRACERAVERFELEPSEPMMAIEASAAQAPSPRSEKFGDKLRRSMESLFSPRADGNYPAADGPKTPRSEKKEEKEKKSGGTFRRSFDFRSPRSAEATPAKPEKRTADEPLGTTKGRPTATAPSLSPRGRAATLTTTTATTTTTISGGTPLANVLRLYRDQRDYFIARATQVSGSAESAAQQYALIERFLVRMEPSLNHATLAKGVGDALTSSGLKDEEMKAIEKSCGSCRGWFGGSKEAGLLEQILLFAPVYIGRFKAAS